MPEYELKLVDICLLKPHEMIMKSHLDELVEEIRKDGYIKDPIIIDKNTMIILDGHHRFNALKIMKLKLCPVYMVDYKSNKIIVGCWRSGERITKEQVIAAGISQRLMTPKSSKHKVPGRPKSLMIPLAVLH